MALLNLQHVTKVYNERGACPTSALNGINLTIDNGEFVGIMGPSGSGKTTLLNVLSGLDRATAGIVEINNTNIVSLSDSDLALFRRRQIGFVFQDFNLLDSLSVKENILLPLILDRKEPDYMDMKADEVMSLFGIQSLAGKQIYEISGGEQQRVSVSRAIINDPQIVLADEPTGNLDSRSSLVVMNSFLTLNRKGHTILIVTHDPFASSFCKRVVFIRDGVVTSEITSDDSRSHFLGQILHSIEGSVAGKDDV